MIPKMAAIQGDTQPHLKISMRSSPAKRSLDAKNALTIPPFRAYIMERKTGGAAPARFTMSIEDEEATGIVFLEEAQKATAHCTDLLGRPLSPSAKGLLIMNHKKLLSR